MMAYSCNGQVCTHSWSDDSYSTGGGSAACPALTDQRCPASDCPSNKPKEATAVTHPDMTGTPRRIKPTPQPDPNITVAIPVKIGGYTGQRDQWETHTYQMSVTLSEDATLILQSSNGQHKLDIPWETLKRAVELVSKPSTPSGQVLRQPGYLTNDAGVPK